jgi:predicted transcriptional regulator of viral defense system
MTTARVKAPHAADWALSQGMGALTTPQIAGLLGVPPHQVPQRLAAPKSRGEWVCPARGLWVPVPPEYRAWGGPPGLELVPLLAGFLKFGCYIGWMSAAALHGAAHQAAQVVQIAASRRVRDRDVGRARLRFNTRPAAQTLPTVEHVVRTGAVRVSSPELTALDLAADIRLGANIDNVATVIVELTQSPGLDVAALAHLAGSFPAAAARRVGWILDRHAGLGGLDPLASLAGAGHPVPSRLSPTAPETGKVDQQWNLRINHKLEVEA